MFLDWILPWLLLSYAKTFCDIFLSYFEKHRSSFVCLDSQKEKMFRMIKGCRYKRYEGNLFVCSTFTKTK